MNRLLLDGIFDHRLKAIRAYKGGCGGRSRRLGVSAPLDHAMDFLGNAKAIVADIRDRLNRSLSIVGGADLSPGKRVYLLDLIDEKG